MEIEIARCGEKLFLGRRGENFSREVRFDISKWRALYGPGSVQLLNQRPREDTPYPCTITVDGDVVKWIILAADVDIPGRFGSCELSYIVGDQVAKSEIWPTVILDSLGDASDSPPDPQKGWVDKVLQAGADAEAAAQRAEDAAIRQPIIGENGCWYIWDVETGNYRDTGMPSSGGGNFPYQLGKSLKVVGINTLEVNTTDAVEADNTLPITAAAVHTTVGNIDALLQTI